MDRRNFIKKAFLSGVVLATIGKSNKDELPIVEVGETIISDQPWYKGVDVAREKDITAWALFTIGDDGTLRYVPLHEEG